MPGNISLPIHFDELQIGDFVEYAIQTDQRPMGCAAKVIRKPERSAWVLLLMPYDYKDIHYKARDIIMATKYEVAHCYRTARWIAVSETILSIHPGSPCANRVLRVAPVTAKMIETEHFLALYGTRVDLIPVECDDAVWFVEPEHCVPLPF